VKLRLGWYATEYLSSMGWVGLGYEKWTHGHVWYSVTYV